MKALPRPVFLAWTFACGAVPAASAQFGGAGQDPPAPAAAVPAAAAPVEDAPAPQPARSAVTDVTVYQGTALVTREVAVPEGRGLVEVVVTPLPAAAIPGSLYSEGADGLRVLSTRYRARAIREDTRAAVRAKEQEVRDLEQEARVLQAEAEVLKLDRGFLDKLESFTSATAKSLADQGRFEGDQVIAVSGYLMRTRAEKAGAAADLEKRTRENAEALAFAKRQLGELSAGRARTAIDAVILLDKAEAPAATIRLSYLAGQSTWRPQYRLRADGEDGPVRLEYLAAISQQSGEDWADARLTVSTAQPALNAAPPELVPLTITVAPADEVEASRPALSKGKMMGGMGGMGGGMAGKGGFGGYGAEAAGGLAIEQYAATASAYRGQAQAELNRNNEGVGRDLLNTAAALDQARDLLAGDDDRKEKAAGPGAPPADGPTVTFRLPGTRTVPSRKDALLVEVRRIELKADFFDKVVPVLSPRVYRLANLINTSDAVLLPGEATMYVGADFVGRMALPLVAAGEPFTAGFGVDPQVQADRKLAGKTRSAQGGNQVHTYEYKISVRSFRAAPVPLQVWDRLPRPADEDVAVNLINASPELSDDDAYRRVGRPDNLLRWDLTLPPSKDGEAPRTIAYTYRLEFAREMAIDRIAAAGLADLPIGGGANGGFGGLRSLDPTPRPRD